MHAQWQLVLFLLPSLAIALYIIVTGMMGSWILFGANVGALLFGLVPYGCVTTLVCVHILATLIKPPVCLLVAI